MEKLTFEEIQKIIIEKCVEQSACVPEFKKLKAADTEEAFWNVIKQNGPWAHSHGVISVELFEQYNKEKLAENNIFIDAGDRKLETGVLAIIYNGTVSENYGTVSYNGNNGIVSKNYGTVSENNGTVSKNYGTVSNNENYGTVSENYGTVSYNYGTVSNNGNYGTVSENYGTVSKNYGTVSNNGNNGIVSKNNGTVSYNYGTVSKNYGLAVVIERQKKRIYMKKGEFEIIYFD